MFPTQVSKNQFGETTIAHIIGGSNQIDINFVVDRTNGNGLGIRSLKVLGGPSTPEVTSVFMNTSATPLGGNPNPLAGFIQVNFAGAYGGYIGGYAGVVSPVSGTPINVTAGLTVGQAYIITSLGTTTVAAWQALGVPTNQVPAVGLSFIAITATDGTGTGVVEAPGVSKVLTFEGIGDPNQACNPATGGAQVIVQVLAPTISTGDYIAPFIPTAPADGTVIGMRFVFSNPVGPTI